jgi:hypothetical protein
MRGHRVACGVRNDWISGRRAVRSSTKGPQNGQQPEGRTVTAGAQAARGGARSRRTPEASDSKLARRVPRSQALPRDPLAGEHERKRLRPTTVELSPVHGVPPRITVRGPAEAAGAPPRRGPPAARPPPGSDCPWRTCTGGTRCRIVAGPAGPHGSSSPASEGGSGARGPAGPNGEVAIPASKHLPSEVSVVATAR